MKTLTTRILRGTRSRANWTQLVKFGAVGLSGYVVNLVVFGLLRAFEVDLTISATAAFGVALTNNYLWNRHWTFSFPTKGRKRHQAPRFLLISGIGFGINLGVLHLLVDLGLADVPAQAMSVASAMPLNFVANKLWTFRDLQPDDPPSVRPARPAEGA